MKVWDTSTQHCLQTVVGHHTEVWSMDLDPDQQLVFTGAGEGEMMAWRIDKETMSEGFQEMENGEVSDLASRAKHSLRPPLDRSLK